ncbi:MAG TPA: trypsin-like serine protease, partial [Solirubrobacterales bacterium]|nr:trypsin-like serine protease [Solirubrobacterales bacterium]
MSWKFVTGSLLALAIVISLPSSVLAMAGVQPFEVSDYQEDFGISTRRAEAALKVQANAARVGIVDNLENSLGNHFAGVWFDNQQAEFVVPVVGAAARADASSAMAAFGLQGDFRLAAATSTWSELEAAQKRLNEVLTQRHLAKPVQTSLDPKTNSVVILLSSRASDATRSWLEAEAAGQSVSVEVRSTNPRQLKTGQLSCNAVGRVCGQPLRGGVAIGPLEEGAVHWKCTLGFKATGRYTGNRYALTAGHCPDQHSQWYTLNPDEGLANRKIGYLEEAADTLEADWAKYNSNGTVWDQSGWPTWVVYWGGYIENRWIENEAVPISREASSYLGERVCHSGMSSGTHCGYVTELDVTAYSNGVPFRNHLTRFGPTCAAQGDSGGPVFDNGTALGLVSAGTIYAPTCEWYLSYEEITRATDAMGVTVAPRPPDVTTGGVTNLQPRKATIAANVDPNGVSTQYYFEYGTSPSYGSTTVAWSAGAGWDPGQFSGTIDNLKGSTTYHYRLIAFNSAGSAIGANGTFATPDWRPLVETKPATGVKGQKATLNGTVNPQASETKYRFEYGLSTGYGTNVPIPDASVGSGSSTVSVSQALSGLEDGLYHYRIVAYNSDGTSYGGDQTFLIDNRPIVTVDPATNVAIGSATLNGKVNPQAFASTYRFEYVSDADFKESGYAYATKVPVPDASAGSGEADVAVSRAITGLEAETTYRYRIVATNVKGTRIGTERTFHTKTPTPVYVTGFGAYGSGAGELGNPEGMALDSSGNLYVASSTSGNGQVKKY